MNKPIAIAKPIEREFDVLVKFWESKGWKTRTYDHCPDFIMYGCDWNGFAINYCEKDKYEIISFNAFAVLNGLTVPTEMKVNIEPIISVDCVVDAEKVIFKFANPRTSLVIQSEQLANIWQAMRYMRK